ncbi:unnamed protein product [Linum trigynum]|uniref:Uncharacterized protein n=1 Tax=Linum trigynum TaxID=586398 RepID=A0AAV2F7T8_9ROSI
MIIGGMPVDADFSWFLKGKGKAKLAILDGQGNVLSSSKPSGARIDNTEPSTEPTNEPTASLTLARSQTAGARKRKHRSGRKMGKDSSEPPLLWEVWEGEHKKWLDENCVADMDLEQQNGFVAEAAEAPSE